MWQLQKIRFSLFGYLGNNFYKHFTLRILTSNPFRCVKRNLKSRCLKTIVACILCSGD